MKAERTARATVALRSTAAYARNLDLLEPAGPPESAAVANISGIPEAEFTPKVRAALTKLMAEVDRLQREVASLSARLEDAERAADQDQLLPLLNRRAFVRELNRTIAAAARYGTPSSLVYFDLDGFKRVNDTYGHAAGDALLGHIADTLTEQVRDSDVVARLGGDEFGIILGHTSQTQAEMKAASLADSLAGAPLDWRGVPIDVAFSYGAFQLSPGDSADAAIARADERMYARKRSR
ncbi:MAG TPA: GGDEF domain-containing protein [Rhizomicrobium sp.]|jgi:diguanylate cyclase (GGDEF)-like protein